MASVRKRGAKWVADFRDAEGKRHTRTFSTKKAAQEFNGTLAKLGRLVKRAASLTKKGAW